LLICSSGEMEDYLKENQGAAERKAASG
jgi:hypothetical protein